MQNPSRKTKGQRTGKRVQLLVVGDRVLIEPDEGEARTEVIKAI